MRQKKLESGVHADLLARTSQKEAASVLGLDQPKVSKLLRGQLRGFSTDRLMNFLLKNRRP